jgi:hypothetical protein
MGLHVDMTATALRLWLLASQILLASGALAVVLGAAGTIIFGAAKEKALVSQPHPVVAAAAAHETGVSAHEAEQDRLEIAALTAENLGLKSRLTATERDLAAAQAAAKAEQSKMTLDAPRSLTEAQKSKLLAALKAIPGPPQVRIQTLNDPESSIYASEIVKVIESANYLGQLQNLGNPTPAPKGVRIVVKPGDVRGAAIRYAFEAVKIPVIASESDIGAFDAQITIGTKPK